MTRMIDADALIKDCKRTVQIADELKELNIKKTFSAMLNLVLTQPTIEMLTADEMQVIRIHMGAIKERLCNQKRWSEAVDYQIICDKLDKMLEMGEENDKIH